MCALGGARGYPWYICINSSGLASGGGKWGGGVVISAGCLTRQRGEKGKEVGLGASSCLNKRMYLYTIR